MKYCPQCKLELPEASKFCRSCGGELSAAQTTDQPELRCRRCGAAVGKDWKTCSHCSYSLESAPATVKMAVPLVCSKCGAALSEGMKFCTGCGAQHSFAQSGQQTNPFSESASGAGRVSTVIEKSITVPEQPIYQAGAPCRRCGAIIQPGRKFCEKCGLPVAAVGEQSIPDKNRKILFISSGAALALILLIVGWYFWGVSLTIVCDQPGAQVFIDDAAVAGSSDASGRFTVSHVLRGMRTLRVKREGFEDAVTSVKLGIGDFSKTVEIKLSPFNFSLTITSVPPGCKVLVDGKESGSTDESGKLTLKTISRGSHTLTLQRAGFQDWTQSVSLTSSQTIRAELVLAVGGIWQGSFSVSQSAPALGFALNIDQTGATFKGKADQRDMNNTESNATIEGSVNGTEIKYVKRYSPTSEATYKGTIDASGKRATGTWISGSSTGTWVMAKVEKADSGWIAPLYNKIDSFDAKVTDLKFYETGNEEPTEKKYSTSFKSSSTRYINYELNLQYASPGRRIEFQSTAVYYNSDGTVLGEKPRQAHVEADWRASNHHDRLGSSTPGTWKTGFYRVDIFVAGKRIASKWFEIN